jgi:hypothetical protein
MTKTIPALFLASFLAFANLAQPASALSEQERRQLVGAAVGLAIGTAIANERRKEKHRENRREGSYVAKTINGHPVICIPKVSECYYRGRVARRTTNHEFGYR